MEQYIVVRYLTDTVRTVK